MSAAVSYQAEVTRESKKALCCHLNGDSVDHWIPRGQVVAGSQVSHTGDHGRLIVSEWFAKTAHLPQPQGESHHGV
jgi:hypothetical protein